MVFYFAQICIIFFFRLRHYNLRLSVMDLFHCDRDINFYYYFEPLGPAVLSPCVQRWTAFPLCSGGFGGSLGAEKPHNIISLTLIRTFPSSFLPFPFAHPQSSSSEIYYEKRFSIWSNGSKTEKDHHLGTPSINECFPRTFQPICKLQVNNVCHLVVC